MRFKGFNDEYNETIIKNELNYIQPSKYLENDFNNENEGVPILTANKSFILGYTKNNINVFKNVPVMIFDDFTTDIKYVDFNFKVKSSALKIIYSNKKNIKYWYYLLCSKKPEVLGHNRHWISFTSNEKRWIPKINEQQKISNFFSLLDKQIDLYVRKLELSEVLLKIVNNIMYKNAVNNKYVKISKILIPRKSEPINTVESFTPISIMLNGNGFKTSNLKVILSKKGRKYYERIPGDIIIGLQNFHNGSIDILSNIFDKPIMSNAIASFINISIIPSIIIKNLLLNNHHQFYLKNIAEGTGQKEFTINKILNSKIPIPNEFKLNYFEKLITNITRNIELLKLNIKNLKKKKNFYLSNLFI